MFHGTLSAAGRARRITLTVGTLAAAAACSPSDADWIGATHQAVYAGYVDEANDYEGVVFLRVTHRSGRDICSGTLVAPNLVLTAMHCLAPLIDGNFECGGDGSITQSAPGAGEIGTPAAPEDVAVYIGLRPMTSEPPAAVGAQLFTTGSGHICRNDLGLVLLDREVAPISIPLRLVEDTVVGERVTVVGYGMTETPGEDTLRRIRNGVRVLAVGKDSASSGGGTVPPRTFSLEASACKGDSGGPAIAEQRTGGAIVGVNSIVMDNCEAHSTTVHTRLAPFANLITEAFAAAGHEPVTVPPPGDGDAGDTSDGTTEPAAPVPTSTTTPPPPPPVVIDVPDDDAPQRRLRSGCNLLRHGSTPLGHHSWVLALGAALVGRLRQQRP